MRLEVLIDGMTAIHARHAVFTALAAVPGLRTAEVELGRAVLEGDGPLDEGTVRTAVADAGFAVTAARVLPRTLPTL